MDLLLVLLLIAYLLGTINYLLWVIIQRTPPKPTNMWNSLSHQEKIDHHIRMKVPALRAYRRNPGHHDPCMFWNEVETALKGDIPIQFRGKIYYILTLSQDMVCLTPCTGKGPLVYVTCNDFVEGLEYLDGRKCVY